MFSGEKRDLKKKKKKKGRGGEMYGELTDLAGDPSAASLGDCGLLKYVDQSPCCPHG